MKRKWGVAFWAVLAMVMVMFWAFSAQAYTINDSPNDAIGDSVYESYGINVLNYYTGPIKLQLFTNLPASGASCTSGSFTWVTPPADVFVDETYKGSHYSWAIPLVTHGAFNAGTMYAVGTSLTSSDLDPSSGSGYIFNPNVPVQIATIGNNYGFQQFSPGTVTWAAQSGGSPDWMIEVIPGYPPGLYQDDPNGIWSITWGTATCANDIITGQVPQVPIPPSALLLGSGLFGLILLKKGPWLRRRQTAN